MIRLITIAFVLASATHCYAAGNSDIWRRKPAGMALGMDFSGGRTTSPTGLSGTLNGNAAIPAGTRHLSLDGNGDYVSFLDNDLLDITGDFTFSFYVKTSTTPAVLGGIYEKYRGPAVADQGVLIYVTSSNKMAIDARAGTGSYIVGPRSTSNVNDNVWRHVAFTRSGTLWSVYMNGVSENSLTLSANSMVNDAPAWIGVADNSPQVPTYYFTGLIADFRLYQRALTQPELAKIATVGAARLAAGGTP